MREMTLPLSGMVIRLIREPYGAYTRKRDGQSMPGGVKRRLHVLPEMDGCDPVELFVPERLVAAVESLAQGEVVDLVVKVSTWGGDLGASLVSLQAGSAEFPRPAVVEGSAG